MLMYLRCLKRFGQSLHTKYNENSPSSSYAPKEFIEVIFCDENSLWFIAGHETYVYSILKCAMCQKINKKSVPTKSFVNLKTS
jgi:hypothetical protein